MRHTVHTIVNNRSLVFALASSHFLLFHDRVHSHTRTFFPCLFASSSFSFTKHPWCVIWPVCPFRKSCNNSVSLCNVHTFQLYIFSYCGEEKYFFLSYFFLFRSDVFNKSILLFRYLLLLLLQLHFNQTLISVAQRCHNDRCFS